MKYQMKKLFLLALFLFPLETPALAAPIKVAVSIKPLHSLAANLMEGIGTPSLILSGKDSPHHFSLTPSIAKIISQADLNIIVDRNLEGPIVRVAKALGEGTRLLILLDEPEFQHLDDMFDSPDDVNHDDDIHHEDEEHEDEEHEHEHEEHECEEYEQDGHEYEHEHEHEHEEHECEEHEQDEHEHEHEHEEHDHDADSYHDDEPHHEDDAHDHIDSHFWLDPELAKKAAHVMAKALIDADPAHEAGYQANLDRLIDELDHLLGRIHDKIAPHHGADFIVYHDAYSYFERRFGLRSSGVIRPNPQLSTGAKSLSKIKRTIQEKSAICVFSEPQFDSDLPARLAFDSDDGFTAILDPIGFDIEAGSDHYFALITNLADGLAECFARAEGAKIEAGIK